MATKHVLSAILIMVVLSASIYLVFDDNVKINIENTRTKYFVMEDDSWTLAATEYVNLYDGTTKMRAIGGREITYFNDSSSYSVVRISKWKQNITTIQTYKFNKDTSDITEFPSENILECINCQGKIVHYEIRDILYEDETKVIDSPFSFGHRMKIVWGPGAYYSKVFQQKSVDKIIIKYRPENSYEKYSVRLFDPWDTNLNDSLIAAYNFNETSGDLINLIGGIWNGTLINAPTQGIENQGSPTEINKGYNFIHASDQYITLSQNSSGDVPMFSTPKQTISIWFNTTWDSLGTSPIRYALISMEKSAGNPSYFIQDLAGGDFVMSGVSIFNNLDITGWWSAGEWTNFVLTYDETTENVSIYTNNVLRFSTQSFPFTHVVGDAGQIGEQFNVGSPLSRTWDGVISEVNIWEKVLDASERTILYNDPDGMSFGPGFNFEITLNSPENNSALSNTEVNFNCSASEGGGVANLTLVLDDIFNTTIFNSSAIENLYLDINLSVVDGNHNWTCAGSANNEEQFFGENRTFIVDSIYPLIVFEEGVASDNNTWLNISTIISDVDVVEINPVNITYTLSNSSEIVNQTIFSMSTQTSNTSFSWVNLNEGNYTFNVSIVDLANNFNSTETRVVYIDTIVPLINYSSDSDVSNESANFLNKDFIYVNVTVVETNEANITFSLYTGFELVNQTVFTDKTRTINWTDLSENMYFWNVTICDYTNSCNTTSERNFGVKISNLTIESNTSNLDVELGADIDVNATYNFGIVCVDVNHPNYGTNFSCNQFSTDFSLVIDYFRKNIFNDSTTSKVLAYVGEQVKNVFFPSHKYDEVDAFSFNITGVDDSGYPENVLINKSNSSEVDRFFPGLLIGSNIFLDKDDNANKSKNFFYQSPGIRTLRFFIDDGANLVSAYVNISGFKFGFFYEDNFINFSQTDTLQTTAQLDLSGRVFTGGRDLLEFVFDDFEDSSIADRWLKTDDFDAGSGTLIGTIVETSGYVRIRQIWNDPGGSFTGSSEMNFQPNFTFMNLLTSQNITLRLENDYDSTADNTGCTGNGRLEIGGTEAWLSYFEPDNGVGNDVETSRANISFQLDKNNETTWRVRISGYETSSVFHSSGGCGQINGVYNWTTGIFNVTKQSCSDTSGDLDNDFFVEVNYLFPTINFRPSVSASTQCQFITLETRTYFTNNTMLDRFNSTWISDILYDSSGQIEKATFNVNGFTAVNETITLYMSADNGANWENVANGVQHTFIDTGTDLRAKVDFNITDSGYKNLTSYITNFNISTPQGFPSNITIDFGNDGIIDGTFEGELNSTNSPARINLSSANLTSALNGTPFAFDHLMKVPMSIYSDSVGELNISNFEITYSPNPISLNLSSILDYIFSFFGFGDFPISIESINGNITVDDVRFDYAGGNSTFEVLSHNQDYTVNSSLNITYFYSSWDYRFVPSGVEWIYFAPKNSSAKNVEPYGQTDNTPIINLTNYGYGGRNATLSILENDTNACVNTTLSLDNNKSNGITLNQSWQDIANMSYLNTVDIYLFADYACNDNSWSFYDPDYYFRLCVSDGTCSEDII